MNTNLFHSIDILDISFTKDYLSLRLTEDVSTNPKIFYQRIKFETELLENFSKKINELFHLQGSDLIKKIQQLGHNFYHLMISNDNSKKNQIIHNLFSKKTPLVVTHRYQEPNQPDYNLPIEIIYNGEQFLSLTREVYRSMNDELILLNYTKNTFLSYQQTEKSILIVADPLANLPYAYKEGKQLYTYLSEADTPIKFKYVDFISNPITKLDWTEICEQYDWVHFAGHGEIHPEKGAGIVLDESQLFTASDFPNKLQKKPEFMFLSTCSICSLYSFQDSCFIQKLQWLGLKNILASPIPIREEEFFSTFIKPFYQKIMEGYAIGESLRLTKLYNLKNQNIQWIYFHLYGTPYFKLK